MIEIMPTKKQELEARVIFLRGQLNLYQAHQEKPSGSGAN